MYVSKVSYSLKYLLHLPPPTYYYTLCYKKSLFPNHVSTHFTSSTPHQLSKEPFQ